MIDIEYIRSFFPATIAKESRFDRYMLKERQSRIWISCLPEQGFPPLMNSKQPSLKG